MYVFTYKIVNIFCIYIYNINIYISIYIYTHPWCLNRLKICNTGFSKPAVTRRSHRGWCFPASLLLEFPFRVVLPGRTSSQDRQLKTAALGPLGSEKLPMSPGCCKKRSWNMAVKMVLVNVYSLRHRKWPSRNSWFTHFHSMVIFPWLCKRLPEGFYGFWLLWFIHFFGIPFGNGWNFYETTHRSGRSYWGWLIFKIADSKWSLSRPKLVQKHSFQWIGLRENLQETMDFPIKYGVFL